MTDILRPGFPLRINSGKLQDEVIIFFKISTLTELFDKKDEVEEEEYMLKWGEHNNQVINIFHQLCQVNWKSNETSKGISQKQNMFIRKRENGILIPPQPAERVKNKIIKCWLEFLHLINGFYFQDNLLTDVTLATETKTYKAHKLILSACSPYFRNLFINNPCKHPTVFFKDITEAQMDLLMEYMYKGRISVKQSQLENILRTASSLQV